MHLNKFLISLTFFSIVSCSDIDDLFKYSRDRYDSDYSAGISRQRQMLLEQIRQIKKEQAVVWQQMMDVLSAKSELQIQIDEYNQQLREGKFRERDRVKYNELLMSLDRCNNKLRGLEVKEKVLVNVVNEKGEKIAEEQDVSFLSDGLVKKNKDFSDEIARLAGNAENIGYTDKDWSDIASQAFTLGIIGPKSAKRLREFGLMKRSKKDLSPGERDWTNLSNIGTGLVVNAGEALTDPFKKMVKETIGSGLESFARKSSKSIVSAFRGIMKAVLGMQGDPFEYNHVVAFKSNLLRMIDGYLKTCRDVGKFESRDMISRAVEIEEGDVLSIILDLISENFDIDKEGLRQYTSLSDLDFDREMLVKLAKILEDKFNKKVLSSDIEGLDIENIVVCVQTDPIWKQEKNNRVRSLKQIISKVNHAILYYNKDSMEYLTANQIKEILEELVSILVNTRSDKDLGKPEKQRQLKRIKEMVEAYFGELLRYIPEDKSSSSKVEKSPLSSSSRKSKRDYSDLDDDYLGGLGFYS